MYPDAPFIRRQGEVDAWDNPDFRAAVEATGKKQVLLAGITTDVCVIFASPPVLQLTWTIQVCTTFLALSLLEAGYSVYANSDASGTFDIKTAQDANDRMRHAGVNVLSMFAACALDIPTTGQTSCMIYPLK